MENMILDSLLKRPGMEYASQALLIDMIGDCISEIKDALNYKESEELPQSWKSTIKELVLIKYNRDGTEGVQSESQPFGGSVSYLSDTPPEIKRKIYRHRRLRR